MNIVKKILVAVIIIVLSCGILEYSAYKTQSERLIRQGYRFIDGVPPYPRNIATFEYNYFNNLNRKEFLNISSGNNYKTLPILVFGDVLAKSVEQKNENDFNNTLSEVAKRPVHNFASAGWGIQHMYFLLTKEEGLNEYNPDTIIYVYNNDNKNRLTSFSFYPHHTFLNLRYKLGKNGIEEYNPKFVKIYDSYFIRALERFFGWRFSTSKNTLVQSKNFDLIQNLFEASKSSAEAKYSNMKNFIIIRDVPAFESIKFLEKEKNKNKIAEIEYNMWQELKSEGFTVVDTSELINFDFIDYSYKNSDGSLTVPALKDLLPAILEKAGINKTTAETADKKQISNESKATVKKQSINNKTKIKTSSNKNISSEVNTVNADAWSQLRSEIIGYNFYSTDNVEIKNEQQEHNNVEKQTKKSFWSKLKFWNKFKRKKA